MKKRILIFSILACFLLTSCTQKADTAESNGTTLPTEEVEVTTSAVTTTAKKTIIYPDTIDFDDEEEILEIFDMSDLLPGITTTVKKAKSQIIQTCTVAGTEFSFTIGLSKWAGLTSPEQIVQCARTFWYCYPQMYARFQVEGTPVNVTLNIENEGYEVASTSGGTVHIHDNWLATHSTDYDCLTHEFGHVVQSGWSGGYVPSSGEDTYMIERFADYCRYVYAYRDGQYNDKVWTLQTSKTESSYASSNRFWVWLDYTYSTDEIDIMQRMQHLIKSESRDYAARFWNSGGKAWTEVFKGTGAAGKTLDDLWEEFTGLDFSTLDATVNSSRKGGTSKLLKAYPVRETIKGRNKDAMSYLIEE